MCTYCCSVAKPCLTLHNPMDCSTPGFPIPHILPEFTQVHVHWLGGAIQPSYPQSPSSSAFNLSHLRGLFQWASSSHQSIGASASASVLPKSIEGRFPLDWLVWSPCSPRDSQESSPAPQFESIDSSAFCLPYCPALTPVHVYREPWLCGPLLAKWLLFNTLSRFVIGFLSILVTIEHWVEFPVLYSRFSLVIYFIQGINSVSSLSLSCPSPFNHLDSKGTAAFRKYQ